MEDEKNKDGLSGIGFFTKILVGLVALGSIGALIIGLLLGDLTTITVGITAVCVGVFIIIFILSVIKQGMEEKKYSPTSDFRTKLVNQLMRTTLPNIGTLYLRGEGMKSSAPIGKIIGNGFIPYVISKEKKDKDGKIIYLQNSEGKPLLDRNNNQVPERENIPTKDGDTVFVVKQGMFADPIIVRCHSKHHSDLIGDVYLYDRSIVPFGDYFYPAKQWQTATAESMSQQQQEVIVMTFASGLDLVSDVTKMSVGADPTYQKLMATRDERLANTPPPQYQR